MPSIEKVYIKNFKSYKSYSLTLDKKFKHIVIYGQNGVGKTNLLEAISLFSKGRGLRKDKLTNIIKKNQEKFILKSNFNNEEIIYNLISETEKINNKIQ